MPTVACPQCGKTKTIRPSYVRERNFCGHACKGAWQAEHQKAEANPNYGGGKLQVACANCGKPTLKYPSQLYANPTCSEPCRAAIISRTHLGESNGRWKGGMQEFVCIICGTTKNRWRSQIAPYKATVCGDRCFSEFCSQRYTGAGNPAYMNGYKARVKTPEQELMWRLHRRVRDGIRRTLKGQGKDGKSWRALLGYDVETLRRHLQRTMPEGYTWADFLSGKLHLDHKIPVSVFNFTTPADPDFARCWALRNLQLLPAAENIAKGARLSAPFQPSLL